MKFIIVGAAFFLLWSSPVLARQAIFDPQNNSLTLECLRIKQNDQIGGECFRLQLSLDNEGYFAIDSISAPSSLSYESSDGTFNVATSAVDLPEVLLGLDVFSVSLSYDAASRRLSFNSATHLRTESQNTEAGGSCDLSNNPWFAGLGAGFCLAYDAGIDVNTAKQACLGFEGTWNANSTCPNNYISTCVKTDATINVSFIEYGYDIGIGEFYDANVSVAESMGMTYTGPTPAETFRQMCEIDGGEPLF